ncbi:MAG: hypothetical protein C4539_12650 [Ignavibacteriales bacterium]|nr:MAG: hypothetical protein C4539_12650 [Ignavibacteriales bacterium]
MERNFFILLILLCFTSIFIHSGCSKEESNPTANNLSMTEEDAADYFAACFSESSSANGLSSQINESTYAAVGSKLPKASKTFLFDTVIVKQKSGEHYSYYYTISYGWDFTNLGNKLIFNFTIKGNFNGTKVTSVDTSDAVIYVNHIIDLKANYLIEGSYTRKGNTSSKVRNKVSFTSTLNAVLDSIEVEKLTRKIMSGAIRITFAGKTSTGKEFNFTGELSYLGNSMASLKINSKTFTINLATGEVVI